MRKARDILFCAFSICLFIIYIPHFLAYFMSNKSIRLSIKKDINVLVSKLEISLPFYLGLLFFLHNNRYFRTIFYHRIGPIKSLIIRWYRPGDRYFSISKTTTIGGGFLFAHPFSTILNAESIGENFSCRHCTTLGAKANGRPIIGNNVSLGANVTIIGNITIGDNVIIGAGSVVVKDIPSNCIVAGNPAKVIRCLNNF